MEKLRYSSLGAVYYVPQKNSNTIILTNEEQTILSFPLTIKFKNKDEP